MKPTDLSVHVTNFLTRYLAAQRNLSPNTIKSCIRSAYRKIGASTRTQAVLWGVQHGLMIEHSTIDNWKAVELP